MCLASLRWLAAAIAVAGLLRPVAAAEPAAVSFVESATNAEGRLVTAVGVRATPVAEAPPTRVLVLVEESSELAAASGGVTQMGHSSPSHPDIVDLRTERQRHAMPEALRALRDQLAVDGLIAAIGMGRDSFHPRFLLNPEVCSLSCC